MQTLSPEHCWPQIKHLGMGLMHKSRWSITQVYNGQLTLLTETLTQRETSKDTFFSIAHSAMQFGEAAYHLWCKVTAKWPTQQCVLPIMNQTAFQFGHIYIYIYSFPVLFMFELCLTISYFMIKTHCRFDQPMSGTNVGTNVGTHVQGRICSSCGTNAQLFQYRCSGTIVQRPARSRWRSSRKQLS